MTIFTAGTSTAFQTAKLEPAPPPDKKPKKDLLADKKNSESENPSSSASPTHATNSGDTGTDAAAIDSYSTTASTNIWDPVRRKQVSKTPEEQVRQKLIAWLAEVYQIPLHRMQVEVDVSSIAGTGHGESGSPNAASKGENRADLVVWEVGDFSQPWLMAECKRPGIKLDESVLDQVRRYTRLITPKFVLLTNGTDLRVFERYGGEGGVSYREVQEIN